MNSLLNTPKHADLIYDLGLHKGEDSEFYLRKGFRVVAFEADPDLIAHCKKRLKQFIDSGQLQIIEGAIVSDSVLAEGSKVVFYKNVGLSVWGTTDPAWADRNNRLGANSVRIEVEPIDFSKILEQVGIPHYMKIDLEGADLICVNALKKFSERPNYISIESNKTRYSKLKSEMQLFVELGYDAFQAVEQSSIPSAQKPPMPSKEGKYVEHEFEEGCSGLFGAELDGPWMNFAQVTRLYRIIHLCYSLEGDDGIAKKWKFRGAYRLRRLIWRILEKITKNSVHGWYDTHARHRDVNI